MISQKTFENKTMRRDQTLNNVKTSLINISTFLFAGT